MEINTRIYVPASIRTHNIKKSNSYISLKNKSCHIGNFAVTGVIAGCHDGGSDEKVDIMKNIEF